MLTEEQETWLAALESGIYKKGKGRLESVYGFCCLGVACAVLGATRTVDPDGYISYDGHMQSLPATIVSKLKLLDDIGRIDSSPLIGSLAYMNDSGDATFADIAAFIRANPEKVFTNA